jgi:hypothetical protein
MGNVNSNTTNNINNSVTNTITKSIQESSNTFLVDQEILANCSNEVATAAFAAVEECTVYSVGKMPPEDIPKVCNFNPCIISDVNQKSYMDIQIIVDIKNDLELSIENAVKNNIANTIKDNGGFSILGLNESTVTNTTNSIMNALVSVTQTDIDNIVQKQIIVLNNVGMKNVRQEIAGKFILDKVMLNKDVINEVQKISNKISQSIISKRNIIITIIICSIILLVLIYVLYKWVTNKKVKKRK